MEEAQRLGLGKLLAQASQAVPRANFARLVETRLVNIQTRGPKEFVHLGCMALWRSAPQVRHDLRVALKAPAAVQVMPTPRAVQ